MSTVYSDKSSSDKFIKNKGYYKNNNYSCSNKKNESSNQEKKQKIAVFLDGSNFFFMQRDCLDWFVDPKKLLNWVGNYGNVVDANYYTTIDTQNEGQMNYMRALNHMGFRVEYQDINPNDDYFDGSVDLEMIIDILTNIDNYDTAVIVSGHSDFARIVDVLRNRGKNFMVLSTKGVVGNDLRSAAGMHYHDFIDLRKHLEKK